MDVAKVEINSPKLFWLSGYKFAQPTTQFETQNFIRWLKDNNIDTIVNLSDYPVNDRLIAIYNQGGVAKILRYPLDDRFFDRHEYPAIKKVMDGLHQRVGKRVLVHCTAGINRSATFVAYSILQDSYLGADDIINKIKESNYKWRREQALINPTFVDFLKVSKFVR